MTNEQKLIMNKSRTAENQKKLSALYKRIGEFNINTWEEFEIKYYSNCKADFLKYLGNIIAASYFDSSPGISYFAVRKIRKLAKELDSPKYPVIWPVLQVSDAARVRKSFSDLRAALEEWDDEAVNKLIMQLEESSFYYWNREGSYSHKYEDLAHIAYGFYSLHFDL